MERRNVEYEISDESIFDLLRGRTDANREVPVNRYLWQASLDILSSLPIESADPFSGLLVTGWGNVRGTGEFTDWPVQAVYRCVGYRSEAIDDLPFDERKMVLPNVAGRVLDVDGAPLPGVYATGWVKRGPVGLIGHTKSDAMETVRHIINDQGSWWQPVDPSEAAIPALLASRGVAWTDLEGWHRLDEHEMALGAPHGRARVKVVPRDAMIEISRGEA